MKIIFFGSDDFALKNLETLSGSVQEVVCCVTPPDRPKGRGMKVAESVIKEWATRKKIPLLQPARVGDPHFIRQLKEYNCDLFVVIAYGQILPPEVLQVPYLCAMNVHASLLPKYRGAAPINWAIINGEPDTGVSIIKMNARMDAGDIFAQASIKIKEEDTAVSLRSKLAELVAGLLLKVVNSLEKNAYTLTAQDSQAVTLAPKLTKELGKIAWDQPARKIHNLVRGLLPWPAAYTSFNGKTVKILETNVFASGSTQDRPGTVLDVSPAGLLVATGQGSLLVKTVHPASAKVMAAKSFAAGHKLAVGSTLGQ